MSRNSRAKRVRFWRFPAEIAALQKQLFYVCVQLV